MQAADLAEALEGRREGNQYRCRCPVHGGRSLMVKDTDRENPVVYCMGGCEFRDIVRELEARGLWESSPKPAGPPKRKIEWSRWVVPIYEAARQRGDTLSAQDHADYRKARAVLREAGV